MHLKEVGYKGYQTEGDADRLIVTIRIAVGDLGQNSVVVEEDTGLLILMTALAKHDIDIKMLIPANKNRQDKIFSNRIIQSTIGDTPANLLFLHAIRGCDTTSAFYRRGKQSLFKILQRDHSLQSKVIVFLQMM